VRKARGISAQLNPVKASKDFFLAATSPRLLGESPEKTGCGIRQNEELVILRLGPAFSHYLPVPFFSLFVHLFFLILAKHRHSSFSLDVFIELFPEWRAKILEECEFTCEIFVYLTI
jgi:hypothetical protein